MFKLGLNYGGKKREWQAPFLARAYNLLISLKVLDLPDDAQSWRIQTIIHHLLTLPVTLSSHARYHVAQICIPAGWLRWWRMFVDQWIPKRKRGRPAVETVDSA